MLFIGATVSFEFTGLARLLPANRSTHVYRVGLGFNLKRMTVACLA